MSRINVLTESGFVIDYFPVDGSRCLFFTFSAHGCRKLSGDGFGGSFLRKNGFSVLAFKSSNDGWYGEINESVIVCIRNFLTQQNVTHLRRIGYGSSMGGYAAIKFSRALNFERVLAISPQSNIWLKSERRWVKSKSKILRGLCVESIDLSPTCEYHVVFDPWHDLDVAQINYLVASCGMSFVSHLLPFSGHPSGPMLHAMGCLTALVLSIAKDGDRPCLELNRRRRFNTHIYWKELALHLLRHRRPLCAEMAIQRALALNPVDVVAQKRQAVILRDLMRNGSNFLSFTNGGTSSKFERCDDVFPSIESIFQIGLILGQLRLKMNLSFTCSDVDLMELLSACFQLLSDLIREESSVSVGGLGRFVSVFGGVGESRDLDVPYRLKVRVINFQVQRVFSENLRLT